MALLMRGLRGEPVKRLQDKLGVEADGIFGAGTEKALTDYQKQHGLAADGVAGPDTFAALGLFELIVLKRGSKGELVKKLQAKLGTGADGAFGPGTEKAVKKFQGEHGLEADGVVGPQTLTKLEILGSEATVAVAKAGAKLWESLGESTGGALDKMKKLFG